jgi:RNA polymerase sigma factor (TIGR02999 family)
MDPSSDTTQHGNDGNRDDLGADNVGIGDVDARNDLWPVLYDELRRIAHARLRKHRPGETLNTTALVHEAYLKLVDRSAADWSDQTHFLSLAARAMRHILVDYARSQTAQKRGGSNADLRLEGLQISGDDDVAQRAADLLTIDQSLDLLAKMSERLAEVVELHFFGGMTFREIAEVTGRSEPTIKRDWRRARTWLYRAMREADDPDDADDPQKDVSPIPS